MFLYFERWIELILPNTPGIHSTRSNRNLIIQYFDLSPFNRSGVGVGEGGLPQQLAFVLHRRIKLALSLTVHVFGSWLERLAPRESRLGCLRPVNGRCLVLQLLLLLLLLLTLGF